MLASAFTSVPNSSAVDLRADPAEMALAAALIAERQHHARLAAGVGQRARVGDGIGDRLVQEHVLAGACRGARRLEVGVVRRGVDHRLDAAVPSIAS